MNSALYQQIQQFYDSSSGLWEEIWGEHLHHGYYGPDGTLKKERRQAQIDLIEELLNWGLTSKPLTLSQILDVGCGIGGSSLYLADKFQAEVTGITLSPVQAQRATERALEAQLQAKTKFLVADALEMPFEANRFDLVWSLESAEHFPNKIKFLQESYRVLKPGGTLLMATWCHRPLDGNAGQLNDAERRHLAEIYRVYALPYVISLPEYEAIATQIGFNHLQTADWSVSVAPFWNTVINSAFDLRALMGLVLSGWTTIQAALALPLMSRGYETGLIRFGLLQGTK
ncbi:methyltransferase domain-containing protein [Planktothrix pseudagardhii]|uniref:Tocopherol O-methyltransferase, chloroplastic n=1 Tax=Planktothrix pseudagardhii TaxID=132604 RepID=A0A9W4G978_9CYAN|nr:methyltransferase domain-containing protein [Planktothrix pseudagardhii]CAD5966611.1 Tocopherol O-methyltransferase, chloroplastic [Planktothrix pseudagardhii]